MSIGGGDEIGTADVYDSPYFGRIGSGSIGRRMDREYEQSLSSGIPYPSTGEPRLNPGVTPMPGGKGGGQVGMPFHHPMPFQQPTQVPFYAPQGLRLLAS